MAVGAAAGMACTASMASAQPPARPPLTPRPAPISRPAPRPAPAPGPDRGFVTFGAGAQIGSMTFSDTHSEPLYGEEKTWTADYDIGTGIEFEAGAGWRVWHNLFAAATYSRFQDSRAASVSAEIPHPFFFNQPRRISGESFDLSHSEDAGHLSAWWSIPVGRRLEVALFGGPSIISVSRQLVEDVEFTEVYPYDSATFSVATVGDARKTTVGAHAGVAVTWLWGRRIGVGGIVRYSRAGLDVTTPAGDSLRLDAGGLQAAITARIRIAGRRSTRPTATIGPRRAPPPVAPTGSDNPTAVTRVSAPIFLRPDATLTPLRQVPAGTRVKVLEETPTWLRVEFEDSQYGRRVGYLQVSLAVIERQR